MLRSRVLAMACLFVLPSGVVRAEAVKAEQVAGSSSQSTSPSPASVPAQAHTVVDRDSAAANSAVTAPDSKPHISVAATPVPSAVPVVPVADAAPVALGPAIESGQLNVLASEPAKPAAPPLPTLTAQIDLGKQTMVVSENGDVKHSWPISSGTAEFPTPRGTFRPQWVAKMWYSRKYDNAPMPNAVFINGGVAVHATPHVSRLGTPASHGCIRLAPGNAKTFYGLVQKHGLKMVKVSVYGTPKWHAPAIASRKAPPRARYASQQEDNGFWFSGPKKYQPASAYDPRFTQQRRYQPVPPRGYRYVAAPAQRVAFRAPNGQRLVYVQRPQRRVYYNTSGYGYGGGW